MASWVFCNRCFQPPRPTACFSLTSCGHVYCDGCLSKGKTDECLICKVPCHTVLLSKHTDSGIQALFAGVDSLCKKYSKQTSEISEFQEKHRKRLLAFYREKISRLEDSLRKSVLRVEQLHSMRLSQDTAFSTKRNPVSTPSAQPDGFLFLPPDSSASGRVGPEPASMSHCLSDRVESMEVDHTPSPRRRLETASGPTRISLISPPQDGRMGGVFHRGPQPLSLMPGHSSGSQGLRIPGRGSAPSLAPQAPGRAGGGGSPSLGGGPHPVPRPPISIAGLLQRQHLGSAGLGAAALERRPLAPGARLPGRPASPAAPAPRAAATTDPFYHVQRRSSD